MTYTDAYVKHPTIYLSHIIELADAHLSCRETRRDDQPLEQTKEHLVYAEIWRARLHPIGVKLRMKYFFAKAAK